MIDTTVAGEHRSPEKLVVDRAKDWSPWWNRIGLGIITLISLFMNFYQLGQNGFANLYYAAGVKSMADSIHNFFFVSFDPGGFVTIDKPPLGFWLQVASVKVFGFTPFAVYLPEALAGVGSVLLLYAIVRRQFGAAAGLLAALALALSPISVVVNRNNTIDSTLVLTMLLGAWAVVRAAESGKLRWLLLCAVFVGLGFNVKMLEAYLVVPAFGLLYLLAAPRSVKTRILHLLLAGLLLLVITMSWITVVDLIPASQRPYVGSSQNNSEISLAIGYNGISRLLGTIGIGGGQHAATTSTGTTNPTGAATSGTFPPFPGGTTGGSGTFPRGPLGQGPGQGQGQGTSGMFNTGNAGLLRLFNEPLASQTAWLLPIAMLGMIALAWAGRPRLRDNPPMQSLILWGTWLLTMGIFFSVAGFFHEYYLSALAPAICAGFGIGIIVMWQQYRQVGWRGWLLPLALIATALEQIHILTSYPAWGQWLIPLTAILCIGAALVLCIARLVPRIHLNVRVLLPVLCLGAFALMITPTVWATIPVIQNEASALPTAGPTQTGGFGNVGNVGNSGNNGIDTALIRYLEAHQGNATYLVATASSNTADAIILATNKPVMAMGGFSGSDPILTTSSLAALVAKGTVKYFLVDGTGGGAGPGGGQSSLTTWIIQHCTVVPSSQWQSSSSSATTGSTAGQGANMQLYMYTAAK